MLRVHDNFMGLLKVLLKTFYLKEKYIYNLPSIMFIFVTIVIKYTFFFFQMKEGTCDMPRAPEVILASSDVQFRTSLLSRVFHLPVVFLGLKNAVLSCRLSCPGG